MANRDSFTAYARRVLMVVACAMVAATGTIAYFISSVNIEARREPRRVARAADDICRCLVQYRAKFGKWPSDPSSECAAIQMAIRVAEQNGFQASRSLRESLCNERAFRWHYINEADIPWFDSRVILYYEGEYGVDYEMDGSFGFDVIADGAAEDDLGLWVSSDGFRETSEQVFIEWSKTHFPVGTERQSTSSSGWDSDHSSTLESVRLSNGMVYTYFYHSGRLVRCEIAMPQQHTEKILEHVECDSRGRIVAIEREPPIWWELWEASLVAGESNKPEG